jgi:energy-coupling factor transporter transmembrane protein EcfT
MARSTRGRPNKDIILSISAAVVLVIVMALAFFVSKPSTFQQYVIVVVLGFVAMIISYYLGGRNSVKIGSLTATGAAALFIAVVAFWPHPEKVASADPVSQVQSQPATSMQSQGKQGSNNEGYISESTDQSESLESFMADIKQAYNVTIRLVDCTAAQKRSRIDTGTIEGKDMATFLENVQNRISSTHTHYSVEVKQEGVLYEIHCQ